MPATLSGLATFAAPLPAGVSAPPFPRCDTQRWAQLSLTAEWDLQAVPGACTSRRAHRCGGMLARLLGAWVLASPEALGQNHADPARLLPLLELVSSTPSHSVGRLAVTQPHTQEGAASFQVL